MPAPEAWAFLKVSQDSDAALHLLMPSQHPAPILACLAASWTSSENEIPLSDVVDF